jgi:predicted RNase H-like HicB family nuclease
MDGVSMKINVLNATMTHSETNGYFGQVRFEIDGHKQPYEMTLQSDRRLDDWNYSLNFMNEPGSGEEIDAVERAIEENDDLFDTLVEAAVNSQTET